VKAGSLEIRSPTPAHDSTVWWPGLDNVTAALAFSPWHSTRVSEFSEVERVPPTAAGHPLVRWWTWFLGSESGRLSPWRTILWWEVRRLPYNGLLAVLGSASLLVFFWTISQSGELKPGEDAEEPLALLAAPVLANVAYTLGWMTELVANVVLRSSARRIGPGLLRVGLAFSAVVVFTPAAVWVGHMILIRR
jgi:hypothetical protein